MAESMIFRLSQKLNSKIKAGARDTVRLDDNPYADWSGHLFTVNRTQYILLSNTKSLYSCVMYAKGITNDGIFIERALSAIREFMQDDGQQFVYRTFIAPACESVHFAKALNRSVTGSMNDLINHATYWLAEDDLSPHDLGIRLNDILLSALATEKPGGYGKPNEAFKRLAGRRMATESGDGP
jgi:hypothetical protein